MEPNTYLQLQLQLLFTALQKADQWSRNDKINLDSVDPVTRNYVGLIFAAVQEAYGEIRDLDSWLSGGEFLPWAR